MVEKLFPDPFLKTQNQVYLWVNNLKFYTVCSYCMLGSGLSKYIETKLQTTYFYLIRSFFKNKKRSGTSFPVSFWHDFWRKILCAIAWPNIIVWLSGCLYFVRYWEIYVLELFFNQVVTSWISKSTFNFLIKPFFLHYQNVKAIIQISWERQKLFRWSKKYFSPFLKEFNWIK